MIPEGGSGGSIFSDGDIMHMESGVLDTEGGMTHPEGSIIGSFEGDITLFKTE